MPSKELRIFKFTDGTGPELRVLARTLEDAVAAARAALECDSGYDLDAADLEVRIVGGVDLVAPACFEALKELEEKSIEAARGARLDRHELLELRDDLLDLWNFVAPRERREIMAFQYADRSEIVRRWLERIRVLLGE